MKRMHVLSFTIALCLFFQSILDCHATFVEQILGNTKTISLANTCTADPPGHMSVHYNPAGLSKLRDGRYISQGFAGAYIQRNYKFTPDPSFQLMNEFTAVEDDPLSYTTGKVKNARIFLPGIGPVDLPAIAAPVPLGISYREPGSPWTFATTIYAPYAGGLSHDDEDPARFQGKSVYLQHIIMASPSFSYRVNEKFSFGLSIGIGMTALGLITDARAPNELVAMTKVIADATAGFEDSFNALDLFPMFGGGIGPFDQVASTELTLRDSFTPHFNFGFLWEPKDWFAFGAVYQSPIKLNLEGRYKFTYSDQFKKVSEWLGGSALVEAFAMIFDIGTDKLENETGRVVMKDFQFPQRVQMGVMFKPFRRLKLLCDLHWANWSTTQKFVMEFDQKLQALRLLKLLGYTGGGTTMEYIKNFNDTWHYSVGIEYKLLDWLSLRAGYEDRQTCGHDNLFDLMSLPDVDYYGAGIGLNLPRGIDIDFALGYLTYKEGDIYVPNDTSFNLNSNDFSKPVYNPYAGQNVETNFAAYLVSTNISMPFEVVNEILDGVMRKVGLK
ncbi:outer membrane insertion [Candidatus Magnetomorum sp. HK-1]|nr:outer membrane insertion [Candidatus Magnetomorum sp. HK-1]